MTLTVALIAAGLILLFWRKILVVIVWLVLAMIILGVFTVLQPADGPVDVGPTTGIPTGTTGPVDVGPTTDIPTDTTPSS